MKNNIYTCPEANLRVVIQHLQACMPDSLFGQLPTHELLDAYQRAFPPVDGRYEISYDHLTRLGEFMMNEAISHLVDDGCMTLHWDDNMQDFAVQLTPKGIEEAKKHL